MSTQDIGLYLKKLRTEKGLTQRELAKEINITHQAISNWENGKSLPDVEILKILANYYNISVDEILKATTNIKKPSYSFIIGKIIGSILIIINVFLVLQYFLFERHIITIIIYTILPSILLILGLFLIKKYYNYILLFLTILVIVVVNIANTNNPAYYNLDYIPRYIESTRVTTNLGTTNQMHMDEFVYNDIHYLVAWDEEDNHIYLYNLNENITEFETVFEIDDYYIFDIVGTLDGLYASVYKDNDSMQSKIIRLDLETGLYTTLANTEVNNFPSNLYSIGDFLYITETLNGNKLMMYRNDEEIFYQIYVFDVNVYDIVEHVNGYTISYCEDNLCNVFEASHNYTKLFDYFDTPQGSPLYLVNGYNKVVASTIGETYYLYEDGTVEDSHISYYHSNDIDSEIIDGMLYQEGKLISDYSYVTQDYNIESALYFYGGNSQGYLFFSEGNIVKANFYPYEIENILFKSDTRELLIFGGMCVSILTLGSIILIDLLKKSKK